MVRKNPTDTETGPERVKCDKCLGQFDPNMGVALADLGQFGPWSLKSV